MAQLENEKIRLRALEPEDLELCIAGRIIRSFGVLEIQCLPIRVIY